MVCIMVGVSFCMIGMGVDVVFLVVKVDSGVVVFSVSVVWYISVCLGVVVLVCLWNDIGRFLDCDGVGLSRVECKGVMELCL